ncbi:MAG: Teichuronic acid biosynthesis protein TuaB [Phycisphaerae bacterium]|nr:Teichuronic acid biosynthesis protein TuaB [Phycisphaerae bacterium]
MVINTSKMLKATVWSALENISQQLVLLAVQLILARLLGPKAFGLVAMLAIFYALVQTVVDSGFANALIQKKEVTSVDCSSVFYFNISLGVLMAGLLSLSSPWIAAFYDQPILVPLTCWLSVNNVINAFGAVQHALLKRQFQFRKLLSASFPASVASGVVGVGLALMGAGVWAIIAQMLAMRLVWVALMWVVSNWRPTREFSWSALRKMFGFGSKLMATSLIAVIFDNLNFLVIGKIFDAVSLGLYSNARRLQMTVSVNINSIVSRVAFSAFSQVQEEPARLRQGFRRVVRTLALFSGLMAAMLLATAGPLVRGLLGRAWIPAIPYIHWLAALVFFFPLSGNNVDLVKGRGRSDLILIGALIKQGLIVANLVIAWRWGIQAIVIGQVGVGILGYLVNAYLSSLAVHCSVWRQVLDIVPSGLVAAVVCVAMLAVPWVLPMHSNLWTLIAEVVVGTVCWLVISYGLNVADFRAFVTQVIKSARRGGSGQPPSPSL